MKAFMNWSGGKDSSLCLYEAKQQGLAPQALLTSMNQAFDRISMHGVRRVLLERQARALNLPLHTLELPEQRAMDAYEAALQQAHRQLKNEGFTHALYGDIFLEDLKQYRDAVLEKDGLTGIYPLWKKDSTELLHQFIDLGFRAVVVCVNSTFLDKRFCGRELDRSFLQDLPADVDPCGENGEFHSFVFDGPIFSSPVSFTTGETVFRQYDAPRTDSDECFTQPRPQTGFYFCDLLP
jgi:uncharacterized protein (TIGR00290 family)